VSVAGGGVMGFTNRERPFILFDPQVPRRARAPGAVVLPPHAHARTHARAQPSAHPALCRRSARRSYSTASAPRRNTPTRERMARVRTRAPVGALALSAVSGRRYTLAQYFNGSQGAAPRRRARTP
jgi:hypothetical protein